MALETDAPGRDERVAAPGEIVVDDNSPEAGAVDVDSDAIEAAHIVVDDVEEGEAGVEPVVTTGESERKRGSWAARLAERSQKGLDNLQAPAEGEDMNRRQRWFAKGKEVLAAARDKFKERVGSWEQIRDASKTVAKLGAGYVAVAVGNLAGGAEATKRRGHNGLDRTRGFGHSIREKFHDKIADHHHETVKTQAERARTTGEYAQQQRELAVGLGTSAISGEKGMLGSVLDLRRARKARAKAASAAQTQAGHIDAHKAATEDRDARALKAASAYGKAKGHYDNARGRQAGHEAGS